MNGGFVITAESGNGGIELPFFLVFNENLLGAMTVGNMFGELFGFAAAVGAQPIQRS